MSNLPNLSISKPSLSNATTASFISQIHPGKAKPMVYLTHDDLQKRTASLYNRFIHCYGFSLILFTFLHLAVVVIDTSVYSNQSTCCKIIFFADFYTVIFVNCALTIFLYVKFSMFQKEKRTDNMTILKDLKNIVSLTTLQFFFFLFMTHLSKSSCNNQMFSKIMLLFTLQFLQTFAMCLANLLYHFKICREFEMSIALDEESVDRNKKEENFNGSFGLNLSKMSKSNRDKLKYKKRRPVKPVDLNTMELEINVKDLDNLDVIKKSPENRKHNLSTGSVSPTKRLSSIFKKINVDEN